MSLEITEELIARQPPEAQAIIRLLLAEIAKLRAELAALRKTPENSSVPPSSRHPHARPKRDKAKSKRNRGGQPGHVKAERALVPVADCTDVVPCKPGSCRRCGEELVGDDLDPLRHQVWELPEIKPLITAGWPDRSFRAVGSRSDKMTVHVCPMNRDRLYLTRSPMMIHLVPPAPSRPAGPPRDESL